MIIDNSNRFEDYFETVVDNVSESILSDDMWNQHFHAIQEIIHDLYFIKVPVTKAVRIIESIFTNLGNRLNEGHDHEEALTYISGK